MKIRGVQIKDSLLVIGERNSTRCFDESWTVGGCHERGMVNVAGDRHQGEENRNENEQHPAVHSALCTQSMPNNGVYRIFTNFLTPQLRGFFPESHGATCRIGRKAKVFFHLLSFEASHLVDVRSAFRNYCRGNRFWGLFALDIFSDDKIKFLVEIEIRIADLLFDGGSFWLFNKWRSFEDWQGAAC